MGEKLIIKISEECIACGACAAECPVQAIAPTKSGTAYEIDTEKCISCGGCFGLCPVDAIKQHKE